VVSILALYLGGTLFYSSSSSVPPGSALIVLQTIHNHFPPQPSQSVIHSLITCIYLQGDKSQIYQCTVKVRSRPYLSDIHTANIPYFANAAGYQTTTIGAGNT